MNAILEQINSAGLRFVEFALPMLVQSGVLILILLLADFALRKKVRAVFRYWIWLLVLLKLVLPTSLSAPLSLGYFFGDQLAYVDGTETTTETAQTAPAIVSPMINPPRIEAGSDTSAIAPTTPTIEPAVTEPVNPTVAPLSWQGAVFLAWLTVVITMGLLLLQRAIFVRGLVVQAKEANDSMADTLESCRERMGVKRKLGLKVSASATSPAVCGLFRPVILVPQNLASSLNSGQLRAVLLHELAHIRCGDLWVNLAQTLLQIIYFYNLLLWLANSVIRRIREQAVDEMVLVAMGEKAQQYPQTLVDVAKLAFKRPALSLRLIGVVESKSALAGRIKHILNRPMPKKAKLGILGLLVVIIIAAILLPMATCTPGPPSLVIKGVVKDAQTQEPIAEARVFDDGYGPKPNWEQIKANERSEWGAITNLAGEYSFLTWPEHHSIKVEAPGYKAKRQSLYDGHFVFNKKDQEIFDFALEPEKASDSSEFKRTLPNGVTVELVGICEHPSEGKQWWKPDGTMLPEAPYEKTNSYADPENDDDYEIAVRFHGYPFDSINYSSKRIPEAINGSMATGSALINGKRVPGLTTITASFPKNQSTVTIPLGVAAGTWKSFAVSDGRGERSTSADNKVVRFEQAYQKEDKTYLMVWHNFYNTAFHLVAKDVYDNLHIGNLVQGGIGKGVEGWEYAFSPQLSEIVLFSFEIRPYQWITFKNVSLRPGVKTNVQVELEGAKWTRITTSGGKVSVVGSVDGPAVVVRKVPEGTSYFKKFEKHYLLEIVSKSFGQDIMEAIGRKSSGSSSGPGYIQKRIGFGIPFSAKGVDGFRKMRQFRRELRETIKEDIKETLGVMSSGGWTSDLMHFTYRAESIIGTINIFFSEEDEDILQINFVIQEVTTPKDKTDVQVEPGQVAKEPDTQNQELSFGPVVELEIPLLVRDDDIFQKAGLIDFETGRLLKLPQEYMELKKDLGQDEYEGRVSGWCRENGIDAAPIGVWFIEVNAGGVGLVSEELAGKIFLQVTGESWDSMIPQELLSRLQGEQLKGEISFDGASDTFAFRTIEGNIGLLKALSVTDNSIKIRYKMVNKEDIAKTDVQIEDGITKTTDWVVEDYGQTRLLSRKEIIETDNWVSVQASVVKNSGRYLIPDSGLTLKGLIKVAGYNRDKLAESYVELFRPSRQGNITVCSIYSRNLKTLLSGKESDVIMKPHDAVLGGYILPSANHVEFWSEYHFGEVVELIVNDDGARIDMFADLDTGKLVTPPDTLNNSDENSVLRWIKNNGIDVMGETADSVHGLVGFNMFAARVDNYFWDADFVEFTDRLLIRVDDPVILSVENLLPVTYLIKTSEYKMGILQILGFVENPKGIKIRYKLVHKSSPPRPNVQVDVEPEKPAGQVQGEGGAPKQLSSGGGYQNLSREQ